MDIKIKVLNYIKRHNLLSVGDSVICAVSGGADSVCMLDILAELKDEFSLTLSVAHLNHCLRGDEADHDEAYVKELSEKYELPYYSKKIDVASLATRYRISCEEAGRIARYEFFEDLKRSLKADKIATAHNKNDNIETVLMRIMRGTDMRGLSGIPMRNNRNVVRPILCLKRTEIEEYLRCKGINFVTDSTNLEDEFSRNKIRHNIIPIVENQFNENFINVMASNIEFFSEANNYIEKKVDSIYEEIVFKDDYVYSFCVALLLHEDPYITKRMIKKAVFELEGLNISNDLCSLIYEGLLNGSPVTISKNLNFYVKYERAFLVKKYDIRNFSYNINSPGIYEIAEIPALLEISEGEGVIDLSQKNTIYLDKSLVSCNFVLRSRRCGDKMTLANCGTKKIKDILIDEKIPSFLRSKFPVLEYGGKIIWLCGIRDNTQYRAKQGNKYIKISLHKENNNE